MKQELFCLYARAANGVIGVDGTLPWHISADLKRFKALTMGKPMIMGRKTFESFPSPLPGRRHIVLTRDSSWQADGAEVVHSIEEALACAGQSLDQPSVAIVGGAEIYNAFLPLCDRVELTEVHADIEGDTIMPRLGSEWEVVAREDHPADGAVPAFSFVTLEKAA